MSSPKRFVRPILRFGRERGPLLFREDDYPKVRMTRPAFLTYSNWGSFEFLGFFFSLSTLSLTSSCLVPVTSKVGLKWVPQEVLMLPGYLTQSNSFQ